jgi:hypothetical protein
MRARSSVAVRWIRRRETLDTAAPAAAINRKTPAIATDMSTAGTNINRSTTEAATTYRAPRAPDRGPKKRDVKPRNGERKREDRR